MSELAKEARRKMRAKAHDLVKSYNGKVDASDYGPEENLESNVQTGMRPISRRQYKKGGKVVAQEGKDAKVHAGRTPRKSGGMTATDYVNRDVRKANEDREGSKHIGGFKRGGKTKRAAGGGARNELGEDISQEGSLANKDARKLGASLINKSGVYAYNAGLPLLSNAQKIAEKSDRRRSKAFDTKYNRAMNKRPALQHSGNARNLGDEIQRDISMVMQRNGTRSSKEEKKADRWGFAPGYKHGGKTKRAAGGEVPTTRFNIGSSPSMMDKAAGLKRGGSAKRAAGGKAPTKPPVDPNADMGGKNFGMTPGDWDDDGESRPANPIPKGGYNDPYEPTPKPTDTPKKRGGPVHSDEREDRALVKKMVKKESLTGKKEGGPLSEVSKGARKAKSLGGDLGNAALNSAVNYGVSSVLGKIFGGSGGKNSDNDVGDYKRGGRTARKEGGSTGKWIQNAIKHPGALHKELHVPEGKKIPKKKLEKAEHSNDPQLAKRAQLAETLGKLHRASGGRTKGKTNVNVIISTGQPSGQPPMQPPLGAAPTGPNAQMPGTGAPPPMPMPPAGGMPPMSPMGAPMPPAGAPPMPRKRGGRTGYKLEDGAGGGEGRLQKRDWYGKQ